jgi:hypothetical protein
MNLTSGPSDMQIYDITNPANPVLVSTYYNTGNGAQSVVVSGKYAYIDSAGTGCSALPAACGTIVLDVSNPSSPTFVGRGGSAGFGMTVSGKYAYAAGGPTNLTNGVLGITDISNPTAPSLVGSISVTNQFCANVYVSGPYAYLACNGLTSQGLTVVDISNPSNPVIVGTASTASVAEAIYVSGKYAYVGENSAGDLQIFDISNPALPVAVGSFTTTGSVAGVYVSGHYAYLAENSVSANNLQILDVTNPAAPSLVASATLPVRSGSPPGQDIVISGKYMYVGDKGGGCTSNCFQVYDISGINAPAATIGNIDTSDLTVDENTNIGGDVYINGGINAGISGIFSRGTISSYVASSTQTNPTSADFMGGNVGIGTSTPDWALAVVSPSVTTPTFSLVPASSQTADIFDIYNTSGALNSVINSSGNLGIGTTSPSQALSVSGNGYFTGGLGIGVANSSAGTLQTSGNILGGGTLALSGTSGTTTIASGQGFTIGGSQFVLQQGSGNIGIGTTTPYALLSLSASNGSTNTTLFNISSSTLGAIATTSLLSFSNSGQLTIGPNISSVSTSAQLSILAGTSTLSRASQSTTNVGGRLVYVQGRYAYLADTSSASGNFEVWDVSNPAAPARIASSNLNGAARGVYVQGHYAYFVDSTATNGFEVWDISDPAAPVRVSSNNLNAAGRGIYVQGRYAYLADNGAAPNNFEVWDVSNPAAPVRVSLNSLNTNGSSVYVQGRYAYFADSGATSNNFEVWDISNPAAPTRVSSSALNANGSNVYVQGRYAYVVDNGSANFEIWDISNPASPTRVSLNSLNTNGEFVSMQGRYAYITDQGTTNSFEVWDVSSPATPVRVSQNTLSATGFGIFIQGRYAYLADNGSSNDFEVWDLGGAYVQQLEVGGLEAGTLSLRNNLSALDGNFAGGLTVGQSLNVTGSASIVSATSTFNTTANIFSIATASSTAPIFSVLGNGNVGIGTSTPSYLLTVGGTGVSGVVAGFENSNGECTINPTSGSVNCSSDQTLKKNINPISTSTALSDVLQLNPVFFNWNAEATGTPQHSGFIAQQVQPIFPDLISVSDNGTLLLNYAGFAPYLTAAVQTIANISGVFEQNLIAWLGNAENGVVDLFAKNGHFSNELCVGSTCVTPVQFQAMVAAANISQSSGQEGGGTSASPMTTSPSNDSQATDTPPVIQINGNNPAIIKVGATYNDLGAIITGPQADLNLGITTYVNGAPMNPIQIDTTEAATDTIDYVATDQSGLTATSTRTVIIEAPQTTESANDNQATSTPANDNSPPLDATGTDATSSTQ